MHSWGLIVVICNNMVVFQFRKSGTHTLHQVSEDTCEEATGHSTSSTSCQATAVRWPEEGLPGSEKALYMRGVERSLCSRVALLSSAASKGLPDLAVPVGDVATLGGALVSCGDASIDSARPHFCTCHQIIPENVCRVWTLSHSFLTRPKSSPCRGPSCEVLSVTTDAMQACSAW